MKNLALFVCTFILCLGGLTGWYYYIQKQKDAESDLKKVKKSSPVKSVKSRKNVNL